MSASVETLARDVEGLKHDVKNLNGWQKEQNGAIHRVEAKVDKLLLWMLTQALAVVLAAGGIIITLLRVAR